MVAVRADLRPEWEAKQSGLPGVCEAPDAVAAAEAREAAASIQLSLDLQDHSLASLELLAEVGSLARPLGSLARPLGLNAWTFWAGTVHAVHMLLRTRLVRLKPFALSAMLEIPGLRYIC